MTTIKFHPAVLSAHAEFGGDLESMQKCFDWMSSDELVRLVELTASYCHGSAEYWNDKDAHVLIEMARRMAPCTEASRANLFKLRSDAPAPVQIMIGGSDRAVGVGMAIAAGIIMRVWGENTMAGEIMGAAGLDTLEKLRECGVDQYDIDALMPILTASAEVKG